MDGQVLSQDVVAAQVVGEPGQQLGAGGGLDAEGEVEGVLALGGGHRVPPAAGEVEQVTWAQDQLRDRLFRRWLGLVGVLVHRGGAGGAVQLPAFGSVDLEDDHIVVVPVHAEALAGGQ
ncbi:hypothetical protein Y717_31220 [Streptomyces scopuliridis RB72]|uniref:Uncharacterized protein n=1 Tax=Streptomyces scopuliridis RB72 TaxID=1440053 RepID=A0A2T7T8Z7_9ACTN|nr:hypothetical protein Y717_31220 [Streptomyces scopuliridis RB72]